MNGIATQLLYSAIVLLRHIYSQVHLVAQITLKRQNQQVFQAISHHSCTQSIGHNHLTSYSITQILVLGYGHWNFGCWEIQKVHFIHLFKQVSRLIRMTILQTQFSTMHLKWSSLLPLNWECLSIKNVSWLMLSNAVLRMDALVVLQHLITLQVVLP